MTSVNQECRSDLAMDEIENWLKQAVNKKGCTPEIIANAMVSDGHNRNQATILAASAFCVMAVCRSPQCCTTAHHVRPCLRCAHMLARRSKRISNGKPSAR